MILLDNIAFELQSAGGVSLLWRAILDACAENSDLEYQVLNSNKGRNNIFFPSKIDNKKIINESMPTLLRRYMDIGIFPPNLKAFHSSYFRIHRSPKITNIVTVHDFVYEKFDSGLRKKIHLWQKNRALDRAEIIICVSENTKNDLLDFLPHLAGRDVRVIHNGVSQDFHPASEPCLFHDQECYLLYVGGRNKHKNFSAALHALSSKTAVAMNMKLVVVGGGTFTKDELAHIHTADLRNRIIHHGQINNHVLNNLYTNAFAFLYPSFYEGFGIPPLEAMAAGCPVICSNTSSLPEVVGAAALLFNPDQPDEIEEKLNMLKNINVRNSLIRSGIKRAKKFSWSTTGQKTVAIYREILG